MSHCNKGTNHRARRKPNSHPWRMHMLFWLTSLEIKKYILLLRRTQVLHTYSKKRGVLCIKLASSFSDSLLKKKKGKTDIMGGRQISYEAHPRGSRGLWKKAWLQTTIYQTWCSETLMHGGKLADRDLEAAETLLRTKAKRMKSALIWLIIVCLQRLDF